MPEYWIGDVEGRVLGPVSLDVVQDLVNTGRLTEITRVSRDGRNWGAPSAFPEVMTLLVNAPSADSLLQSERQEAARVREQLRAMQGRPPHEIERWLYRARLELRHRCRKAKLDLYVPSLSAQLITYKGLLTSPQLCDYYPDLTDPAFEAGLAIFHRRYSTNTYPNWTLAQPFRFSCHNGEINTLHTNRNAVHAYARSLEPPLPGHDLLTPKASDSASQFGKQRE